VKFEDMTGYKQGGSRTIAGYKESIPIVAAIGKCENPVCGGDPNQAVGDNLDKGEVAHLFLV
jgi:hypothetical protein